MSVSRYNVSRNRDGVDLERLAKAASTAFVENQFVTYNASSQLIPAVPTSTYIVGVGLERVTSSDANYADNSFYEYDQPSEGDKFVADIDSTSGVNVGDEKAINNAGQVRGGAVSTDQPTIRILGILPNNKVIITFKSFTNKS
jgi:hypothetical protein